MFSKIFDPEHILTPIAVEHLQERGRTYRIVYLFGLRVAFYATTKFQ